MDRMTAERIEKATGLSFRTREGVAVLSGVRNAKLITLSPERQIGGFVLFSQCRYTAYTMLKEPVSHSISRDGVLYKTQGSLPRDLILAFNP